MNKNNEPQSVTRNGKTEIRGKAIMSTEIIFIACHKHKKVEMTLAEFVKGIQDFDRIVLMDGRGRVVKRRKPCD